MFLNCMCLRIFRQGSQSTQYGIEVFYPFWVIKVFSVMHSVRLSDVAIFLVVVGVDEGVCILFT